MPYIINTPEDWFRTQQRDLHIVSYRHPEGSNQHYDEVDSLGFPREKQQDSKRAQAERKAWFAQHLPNAPLSIIGPSEYSGWIEGGPTYFTADFDRDGLATFEAAWGPESPWYVEVWLFADWRKRVDAAKLLPTPLSEPQRLRWWDTPRGILLISAVKGHLLSLYDGWWKLQQLFPEFAEYKYTKYPCGEFWPRDEKTAITTHLIVVVQGFDDIYDRHKHSTDLHNIQRLKDALGISENEPFEIAEGDF